MRVVITVVPSMDRMLEEILQTRIMVKNSMKRWKNDKVSEPVCQAVLKLHPRSPITISLLVCDQPFTIYLVESDYYFVFDLFFLGGLTFSSPLLFLLLLLLFLFCFLALQIRARLFEALKYRGQPLQLYFFSCVRVSL